MSVGLCCRVHFYTLISACKMSKSKLLSDIEQIHYGYDDDPRLKKSPGNMVSGQTRDILRFKCVYLHSISAANGFLFPTLGIGLDDDLS